MHDGTVSAELGIGGWPVARGERHGRAGSRARAQRGAAAPPDAPLGRASRSHALGRARAEGVAATAEVTPHHLVPHRRGGALARSEHEDEPAARRRDADRTALVDALRDGTITCVATDHAPHAREEKDAPFEAAPFGVTGLETAFAALHTHLVVPGSSRSRRCSSACPRGPRARSACRCRAIAVGELANVVVLDLEAEWTVTRGAGSARSSANSWLLGETLRGRRHATVADGRSGVRMSQQQTATWRSRTARSSPASRWPPRASPSARPSSRPR